MGIQWKKLYSARLFGHTVQMVAFWKATLAITIVHWTFRVVWLIWYITSVACFKLIYYLCKAFRTFIKFASLAVDFPSRTVRKLLQKESRDKSTFDNKKKKDFASLSATTKVGIAASGMFLACCVFLCPCFFKKRRESAHRVLAKEPNSSESLALAHLSTIRRTIAFFY